MASEEKGVPNGVRLTEESATGIAIELTEKTTLTAGEYYLCNNVNLTQALVIQGDVTLDLNGFVLKITGSGSVIKIESGTLTLVDSHPAAIHKFVKNTDDLWMLDESQGAGSSAAVSSPAEMPVIMTAAVCTSVPARGS